MNISKRVLIFARMRRVSSRSIVIALTTTTATCGVLATSAVPAFATRNHSFSVSIGSYGSGPGQLISPGGIAVDNSSGSGAGDVYVADTGNARVDQFDSGGHFIRAWGWGVADGKEEFEICTTNCQKGIQPSQPNHSKPGQFAAPRYIAVDGTSGPSDGDVYVGDEGTGLVQKFNSSGELIEDWGDAIPAPDGQLSGANAISGPFGQISGIAVDSSGNLWVGDTSQNIFEFDQGSGLMQEWHSPYAIEQVGIAVDNPDDLYTVRGFPEVEEFSSSGSDLGTVFEFGEPPTGIAIDPLTEDLYVDEGSSVNRIEAPCHPGSCVIAETFGYPLLEGATSLAVDSGSGTVYVIDPLTDKVDVFPLEPPARPTVESQSVSSVTAESATLQAEFNPRGVSAEYHFEYGPCSAPNACATSAYEMSTSNVSVGSEFAVAMAGPAHVQKLSAGTTYHYRVDVTNALGTVDGPDQTFTTQAAGGFSLPVDGRDWEMVTPAQKFGALFSPIQEGSLIQASADGNAIVDNAYTPSEADPVGYDNNGVSVLSTRGADGWSSQSLTPPYIEDTGVSIGSGEEYRFFSEDLSRGVLQPFGNNFDPLISKEATESTAYLRTDYTGGDVSAHCHENCFTPLVTASNTPEGTKFGNGEYKCILICGPTFVGATPDGRHVILWSAVQLTSTPGTGLYEWSAGRLQLINVLPEGEPAEDGTTAVEPTFGNGGRRSAQDAISRDGAHILWRGQPSKNLPIHLYSSDTATSQTVTVRLDLPQGAATGGTSAPELKGASSDGTRVFFLDESHLTTDASEQGSDLYEYNFNAPLGNRLTDLTVDPNQGEVARVKDMLGVSEDGSYVYFVAAGRLASGAVAGACKGPSGNEGQNYEDHELCNLYVRHDGTTKLIASLSAGDTADWPESFSQTTARVSPNGLWIVFMSQRDLTGYDTRDAVSGKPDEEVYLYNAESEHLTCASCNPTGARPVGQEYGPSGKNMPMVSANRDWNDNTWLASLIPEWTEFSASQTLYQSRYLSNSGRLFFDSHEALVPKDVNGTWDVYEYEPEGIGSCQAGSETFSGRSDGCVGAISSGSSPEESAFLDASETGGDVFFLTLAKLTPQDFDSALDVYDSHECTAQVPCYATPPTVPPPCNNGDACKPAPTPQPTIFGSPSSATFSGAGNVGPTTASPVVAPKSLTRAQQLAKELKACRKKTKSKRAACERKARRRYSSKTRNKGGPRKKPAGRARKSTRVASVKTAR